jgi:hypothetical protein
LDAVFEFGLLALQTGFVHRVHPVRDVSELQLVQFRVVYFGCLFVGLGSFGEYGLAIGYLDTVQFPLLGSSCIFWQVEGAPVDFEGLEGTGVFAFLFLVLLPDL